MLCGLFPTESRLSSSTFLSDSARFVICCAPVKPLHQRLTMALIPLPFLAVPGAATAGEIPIAQAGQTLVYVGAYASGPNRGIVHFRWDDASGQLEPRGLAAEVVNPSFLAIHPNRRWLYAVSEIDRFQGQPGGAITAFAVDPATGRLQQLNQRGTQGAHPCHVTVHPNGKFVLVANYSGGSVAVFPLSADGHLEPVAGFVQHQGSGINPKRQEGPHAHGIYPDAAGRFVYVPDLGLDQVLVYRFEDDGCLDPNAPPAATLKPGSGPRHLCFHPQRPLVYVVNELLSTVTVFTNHPALGTLHEIQGISTLPSDFAGESTTAEIEVHPSARFLYASNRGHDSITVFAIDQATGRLAFRSATSTLGKTPRHFAVAPNGRWLLAANQASNSIVVFRIDAETGGLTPVGQPIPAASPVCLQFWQSESGVKN